MRRTITVDPSWRDRHKHRAYAVNPRKPSLRATIGERVIARQLERLDERRA